MRMTTDAHSICILLYVHTAEDGEERLFKSSKSPLSGPKAIRGGEGREELTWQNDSNDTPEKI